MSKLASTRLLSEVVHERIENLRRRMADPVKYLPVPTPLRDLNLIINHGFPKSDPFYLVIMGMDKLGKSTIGKHLFMAYCELSGKKGVMYDLEENIWQDADRALTMRSSSFSRTDIYTLNLTEDDFAMMELIADDIEREEVYVNDQTFFLQAMIDDAIARGCTVMCVDNYQLLQGGQGDSTVSRLESNSKAIMRARNNHGLTTFLIAQGNEREKTFGSTQPFRDGDLVLELDYIYDSIPGKKKKGNPLQGVRRLRVKRSRFSGTGELDVVFEPQYSRVRNMELQPKDPQAKEFVEFEEEVQTSFLEEEQEIINGSQYEVD